MVAKTIGKSGFGGIGTYCSFEGILVESNQRTTSFQLSTIKCCRSLRGNGDEFEFCNESTGFDFVVFSGAIWSILNLN